MQARPAAPGWWGARSALLGAIGLSTVVAFLALDLGWSDLVPPRSAWGPFREFFGAALRPAWPWAGDSTLGGELVDSLRLTLVFAITAVSLSVVGGVVLGFLASTAWWEGEASGASSRAGRVWRRSAGPLVSAATRTLVTALRSVHELVWAVLLLASLGLNDLSAVFAIALPYTGVLAKVFGDLVDEAPRDASHALRASGASAVQSYLFGLLPRAIPDLFSYSLYRFECAVRSSAVLGFFGWPTLGYLVRQQWEVADYDEVWTCLYALFLLVALLEGFSQMVRRRLAA